MIEKTDITVLLLPGEEVGHHPGEVVVVADVQPKRVGRRLHPPHLVVVAPEEAAGRSADPLRPEHAGHGAGPPQEAHHGVVPEPGRRQRQERRRRGHEQHGRHGRTRFEALIGVRSVSAHGGSAVPWPSLGCDMTI